MKKRLAFILFFLFSIFIFAQNDYVNISGPIEANGAIPVNLQDQTSRPIIVKFNDVQASTTLASQTALEETTVVLTSVTGLDVGDYLIFFNPDSVRFMFATCISYTGTTVTIDTPLEFAFPAGSYVDIATTDLSEAVGSLENPATYGLRGTGAPPGIDLTVDITRIIITATATDAVDLTKFINLARLTNGLVLRKRDGTIENIFNVKDNKEITALMYDVTITQSTNPNQGVDGLIGRLTFAGQSKIGVAIRLDLGEDLELLVQDDLKTAQSGETIIKFEVTAEGHIVTD